MESDTETALQMTLNIFGKGAIKEKPFTDRDLETLEKSMRAYGELCVQSTKGQGHRRRRGEHHLNTVKRRPEVQNENWLNSIARKRQTKTLCSLFAIDSRLPKLDVAGSNPVSRSNFR
jgi:hypothetical protein